MEINQRWIARFSKHGAHSGIQRRQAQTAEVRLFVTLAGFVRRSIGARRLWSIWLAVCELNHTSSVTELLVALGERGD